MPAIDDVVAGHTHRDEIVIWKLLAIIDHFLGGSLVSIGFGSARDIRHEIFSYCFMQLAFWLLLQL
jgi:hypothetical protein